jgi:hypothetical protein
MGHGRILILHHKKFLRIAKGLFQKSLKVFEDCQGTFFKKFLDRGLGAEPLVSLVLMLAASAPA